MLHSLLTAATILVATDLASASGPSPAPTQPPAAEPTRPSERDIWATTRDQRMAWWREARFGMFVHWGLYSGAGGMWEGTRYEQHYAEWIQNWAKVPPADYAKAMKPLFRPEPGFADAWADLAQQAGMRYAVLTAKHHEGFTLFNSREPYSVLNPITGGTNISPPGRDVAREFADAVRSRGLRAGFYYSLLDWQHPDAYDLCLPVAPGPDRPREHATYVAYLRAHVNELITNYGDLAVLWFDFSDAARQGEAWGADQLLRDLREKQPGIVVNNRLFDGLENRHGDFGTPEKYVPPTGLPGMDWEVNHTLNESYGFSAHDANWKDTRTIIRLLCDIVSKGGNLLLNIGPDAAGRVPEPARRTLTEVGAWMRVNSEAIYGTTASPFGKLAWGRATQKPGVLYLMVFDWPTDGVLRVPLRSEATRAELLGASRDSLAIVRDTEGGIAITGPNSPPDTACSVIRLTITGVPEALPFVVHANPDGTITLQPHDATLEGPALRVEQVGGAGAVHYNLGYWSDVTAFATWPIAVPPRSPGSTEPRRYELLATIACDHASAGGVYTIDLAGQRSEHTVRGTGGWQKYEDVSLGSVELKPGPATVALRAVRKPGEALLNLREMRLVPAGR